MFRSKSPNDCLRHWVGFASVFLCALLLVQPAASTAAGKSEEKQAAEVVSQIRVLALAIDRGRLSSEARRYWNETRALIDSQAITQFVLAERWGDATPAQRRVFASTVADLFVQRVVERLGNPQAEPFEIGATRALDNGAFLVVSRVKFRDGHMGELDWRLHPTGTKFVVADVLVDGVSVSVAARDEAATELKANQGSIAKLIESMQNRVRFQ